VQLAEWKVEAEHPRILDEKRPHLERLGPVRHGQFPPVPLHPWCGASRDAATCSAALVPRSALHSALRP
jgi:hypothetical protein